MATVSGNPADPGPHIELNVTCCGDFDPVVNQDADDHDVWEVTCDSCGEEVCFLLQRRCGCCERDGTHDHARCEHPCCPENDEEDEDKPTVVELMEKLERSLADARHPTTLPPSATAVTDSMQGQL